MTKRQHEPELKAQVVAALLTGQSIDAVAETYRIPRSTVGGWSAALNRDNLISDTKKEAIGDLILAYLTTALETLSIQAKAFADREWLKQQSASEVAVLHGVLADKTIRLLEALVAE